MISNCLLKWPLLGNLSSAFAKNGPVRLRVCNCPQLQNPCSQLLPPTSPLLPPTSSLSRILFTFTLHTIASSFISFSTHELNVHWIGALVRAQLSDFSHCHTLTHTRTHTAPPAHLPTTTTTTTTITAVAQLPLLPSLALF